MELKEFSSLLLSNKASLFLAPLEGGFTVHPPGKFLLAGSQEMLQLLYLCFFAFQAAVLVSACAH